MKIITDTARYRYLWSRGGRVQPQGPGRLELGGHCVREIHLLPQQDLAK